MADDLFKSISLPDEGMKLFDRKVYDMSHEELLKSVNLLWCMYIGACKNLSLAVAISRDFRT